VQHAGNVVGSSGAGAAFALPSTQEASSPLVLVLASGGLPASGGPYVSAEPQATKTMTAKLKAAMPVLRSIECSLRRSVKGASSGESH
jgi:hypothetical protein